MAEVRIEKTTAQRMGMATKVVESLVRGRGNVSKKPLRPFSHGFWAKITAKEPNGKKYSWKMLEAKDSGKLDTGTDLLEGNYSDQVGYAVESKESKWVLKNAIVWLIPGLSEDFYVFDYHPGVRIAKVGSSDINGMSGSSIGKGKATVYEKSSSDSLSSTSEEIDVFNMVKGKVTKSRFVQIAYSHHDACWFVSVEDCEGEES